MRHQIRFLIVTFMLSVLSLGLFSVNTLISMKSKYMSHISAGISVSYNLDVLTNGTAAISAMAVFALALFGAVSAFEYCLKGESTDTYYGLPVTLRGRFWADFLSGYISHVAPLIFCSIFSMIMSVSVDDWNNKLSLLMNNTDQSGVVIQAFAKLNLTLLFSCTFAYLLSVIVTVCCGRVRSSVTYTAVSSIILIITGCAASGFVMSCQLGAGDIWNAISSVKNVPPLGTFFFKAKGTFDLISNKYFNTEEKLYPSVFDDSLTIDPATCIFFTLIIAVLIAAAYFIFKHRKPENTGRPIAVNSFYYVFSGIVAFTLICLCSYIMYRLHMWWLSAVISVVAAGIALLTFTAVEKRGKAHFKKSMIRNGIVIAGCIALLFITDKTGAFGTRYYNISPDKTQSIEISINDQININLKHSESLVIDDKTDIERFIASNNETLKKYPDELQYGSGFTVTYNLSNGKRIKRRYYTTEETNRSINVLNELFNNVRSLPNYPKYSSEAAAEAISSDAEVYAIMHDQFGNITIPREHIEEFREILTREMRDKYDKNAERAGIVTVLASDRHTEIPILKCYTDTISFAESFREYDGDAEAFTIYFQKDFSFYLKVRVKNVNDSAEKELFSLFEPAANNIQANSGGLNIRSANQVIYYVPAENQERVIDLVMTIIEKNFTQ